MGLDLELCLVPKEIEALFSKATNNPEYAEFMQLIPSILKSPDYNDYQNKEFIQLVKDVSALNNIYKFRNDYYYYEESRCSSTIDYLIYKYTYSNNLDIQPALLWEGGNKFPNIKATQGRPIHLYDEEQIKDIFLLLVDLEFSDLLVHYNYEKMQEEGVYKLTRPENIYVLELAFYEIQDLFLLALNEELLVFKVLD